MKSREREAAFRVAQFVWAIRGNGNIPSFTGEQTCMCGNETVHISSAYAAALKILPTELHEQFKSRLLEARGPYKAHLTASGDVQFHSPCFFTESLLAAFAEVLFPDE